MYRIFHYVCGIGTYQTVCMLVVVVVTVAVMVMVVHRRIIFIYLVKWYLL